MDWFAAMEEESGKDLSAFQEGGIRRSGYPGVDYATTFDRFEQSPCDH